MKASEKVTISRRILICPLADRNERGRIAYCFIRACIRKVRWLSMKDKVPSGRREFKPMEIPPVTFEVGSSLRNLGEEVTLNFLLLSPRVRDKSTVSTLSAFYITLRKNYRYIPLFTGFHPPWLPSSQSGAS